MHGVNQPQAPRHRRRGTVSAVATFFGFLGELLLTAGALLGLFVVWQLHWTSYLAQSSMAAGVAQFEKAAPPKVDKVVAPEVVKRDTPPPVGAVPGMDEIFGTLHVPRWDHMEIPIAEGTEATVLDQGWAGHYPDSQAPGDVGNFAVAGHRQTWGHNFRRVHELEVGDPIIVETADAWLVYKMTSYEIVLPEQVEVVAPVPNQPDQTPTKRLLTMTTCDPEWGNSHRYIVYSEFDHWVPRSEGVPPELKGA
ncbi:class E sortase [Buchananella hordeovulneris]|nr:class E sortase [Buchananella hordeovulneris]RRD51026.1 class E sortase [Buchananella hordeovulneris]